MIVTFRQQKSTQFILILNVHYFWGISETNRFISYLFSLNLQENYLKVSHTL